MGKQIVTSIRVDESLWKDAKIYAIKNGISMSDLLDSVLREKIKERKSD
jgi:antitoxin component of RelBE/YafQ-DinJ toxin-antitoxin module